MKKTMKFLALALVAVMALSFGGNVKAAEKFEPGFTNLDELNAEVDYVVDDAVKSKLGNIVKDCVGSCDKVDKVEPAKSTFVAFRYSPVKVVKYDGEAHGMKANAYKTIGGAYVAPAKILYVGMTADKEIYNSFEKPVEVGFYYAVAMYAGDACNYPSVAYGVLVILPECEPECPPVEPENPPVEPEPKPPVDEPEEPKPPVDEPDPKPPVDEPEEPKPPVDEPEEPKPPVEEPEEPKAPVTGDSANFMVYVVMMAAAVVAMVSVKRNRA